MRSLLMGPPGAGKGNQAQRVAGRFGIPAVSTGELFRSHVAQGTALGLQIRGCLDAGEYVPDDLTNRMVRDRTAETDAASGFVLDGYPRTLAQVDKLDAMLTARGHALDAVVVLTVDHDELVGRLLQRAQIESRVDDTVDVIRRRQELYLEQTRPLVEVYRARALLVEIDGTGEVDKVTKRVIEALDRVPAFTSVVD